MNSRPPLRVVGSPARCPICGKPPSDAHRPFCSKRCADIDLGRWLTEQRNVVDDFRRIYGEAPDNPDAIAVAIDSDDTRSTAEAFMGPILFRAP